MSNIRLTKLARALRAQLGMPTSIAVGVALISTTSVHAAIPVLSEEELVFRLENATTNRELVFIDADVIDPKKLLIGLKQGVETIILDRDRDGIEQITSALSSRNNISAVHIVAHGKPGLLTLGNTKLDVAGLDDKSALLKRWFAETDGNKPDIMLYACDLAKGEDGIAFVEQLATLTGTDIAASTDKTGAGGDWDLEHHIGQIDTALAFRPEDMAAYPHSLATFTVTKTADTDDGVCDTDCSLREAIDVANTAAGDDIIEFAPAVTGTITLTMGQIVITNNLEINGPGATVLSISGNNASRIFDLQGFNEIAIRQLTLRDGNASGDGGAIRADNPLLTIEDSIITGNTASDDGGGLYQDEGDLYIFRTEVSNNVASDMGGGIFRYTDGRSDYLTIIDSQIINNQAGDEGAGLTVGGHSGGTTTISNSEISGNSTSADGGGIAIYTHHEGYTTTIIDSTISNNTAGSDGGGIFFYGDDDGYLVVESSTISGNSAGNDGGGIYFESGDGAMDIINSTISGNYAGDDGGGIAIDGSGSGVRIRNSTIVFNEAIYTGGGIDTNSEPLNVYNSIIAGNTSASGPDVYGVYGDFNSTYSLIGDSTSASITDNGGTITDIASGVSPTLVNAGGPTMVHLLNPGSPAINAGEPGFAGLAFDQRGTGFDRVIDGQLDMGAVEMPEPSSLGPPVAVPTLQNWALILLAVLMPGLALSWRRRLEKKQLNS